MSLNLSGFIKSLLPSFSKSDIESDLEISLDSISAIQSTYTSFEEIIKVASLQSKETTTLIKEFYKEIGSNKHKVKLSTNKNIATDTLALFKNVKINGDYLLKEISDAVNDVIVSQALTAYKANLLRSVGHYFFLTRYALDFANFVYVNETEETTKDLPDNFKLNKKQKEFITKNLWIYARLLSIYGEEHESFIDKLNAIEEVTLPKEQVDEAIDAYASNKIDIFNNLPQGFIGSPIYSIRLIFATWESDRYINLKDKKKLLELRYLHLKLMKESGNNDINIEKEITHLQKRITSLDYQLAKIEESIE